MSKDSVHQSVHLVYLLLYHTGCLGLRVKDRSEVNYGQGYKIIGNIYRLIYLTGLIGGFIYKLKDEELSEAMMGKLTPVVKLVLAFECFLSPISYVNVALYLDWYRQQYIKVVNTVQLLDGQLEKLYPGIQWNYNKSTRKYNYVSVILFSYYIVVSSIYIFNIAHCSCGLISSVILSICYSCVTGAPGFAGFLFICHMDILRLRFRLIIELLQQYCMKTRSKTRLMNVDDVRRFKALEGFFMEYSSLIVPLNEIFVFVSGAGLFHDFAIITSLVYLMCSKALSSESRIEEYIFIGLFMLPRLYKLVTTARYGHASQKEQKNCCHEFIKMEYNFEKSKLIYKPMDAFLQWKMHNNYRITVGKVLNCNLSLIVVVLNGVVNYVMILIQLQFQQNNIVKKLVNNADLVHRDVEFIF